jgi:hypothetical protein
MGSWLKCDCGHLIHTNMFCGANVYRLIRDDEFDELAENAPPEEFRNLFFSGREVFHCKNCGRLIVQWEKGGKLSVYVEEPDAPAS